MPGKALTKQQEAYQGMRAMLVKMQDQLAMALPRHVTPDRMLRVVLTTIQRTPKLLECDPKTVLAAVMESAQLGLVPDGVLGHAYILPYGRKAQFIPGYKGLIDLAYRSGKVEWIHAHVVHEHDAFDFAYGATPHLTHKPALKDRGEMIAAYCVAKLVDGGTLFEVMSAEDVGAIRRRSPAANQGPWVTDPAAMWKKSAVKQLARYLPMATELAAAVALDDRAELNLHGDVIDLGEVEVLDQPDVANDAPPAAPPKPAIEQLAEAMDAEAEEAAPEDVQDAPPPLPIPEEVIACCPSGQGVRYKSFYRINDLYAKLEKAAGAEQAAALARKHAAGIDWLEASMEQIAAVGQALSTATKEAVNG